MKTSTRFALPYISLHQSLKEITINEMICELDALTANLIIKIISKTPEDPEDGGLYLVRLPNEIDLQGKDNYLALWINNRWKFIEPKQNMTFYSLTHAKNIYFRNENWNF